MVLAKTSRREKYAIKRVLTVELGAEKMALTVGSYCPYIVGLKESFAIHVSQPEYSYITHFKRN